MRAPSINLVPMIEYMIGHIQKHSEGSVALIAGAPRFLDDLYTLLQITMFPSR